MLGSFFGLTGATSALVNSPFERLSSLVGGESQSSLRKVRREIKHTIDFLKSLRMVPSSPEGKMLLRKYDLLLKGDFEGLSRYRVDVPDSELERQALANEWKEQLTQYDSALDRAIPTRRGLVRISPLAADILSSFRDTKMFSLNRKLKMMEINDTEEVLVFGRKFHRVASSSEFSIYYSVANMYKQMPLESFIEECEKSVAVMSEHFEASSTKKELPELDFEKFIVNEFGTLSGRIDLVDRYYSDRDFISTYNQISRKALLTGDLAETLLEVNYRMFLLDNDLEYLQESLGVVAEKEELATAFRELEEAGFYLLGFNNSYLFNLAVKSLTFGHSQTVLDYDRFSGILNDITRLVQSLKPYGEEIGGS